MFFGISNGQTPIKALNGTNIINNEISSQDGQSIREGIIRLIPGSTFSQTSAGPNQTWNISNLILEPDILRYENTTPDETDLALFPGTTMVCKMYNAFNTSPVSISYCTGTTNSLNGIVGLGGITGYSDAEFVLNYTTNNINLGNFPKVYGDTTTDNVAGTYAFDIYTGTFTGTFTTTVDAYGTMNAGFEGVVNVTRLKTVESLQISYSGLGVVGTFVQTTYRYYRQNDFWPYVKSTNRVIYIEALGMNTNTTEIEKAPSTFLLSTSQNTLEKIVSLFPNPATNSINVKTGEEIISLTVLDQLGKVVLTKNQSDNLDISTLQNGIYFVNIKTNEGTLVKKFIKE
ncbi:MAG: T9SS type A sorting domain-containing protein [Flavobacterium sp.]|nr:MAG: T9SS type A sorting domain-containing protein [Flavobacterium sp.]